MRTIMSQPPTSRVGRYPKHTFFVNGFPFVIRPFFSARVLPGETLQNMYFESRCVQRALPSPIIGWKQQFFFFFVRATDLALDEFKAMFVDPANTSLITSTTLEDATGNASTYCAPGGIDWTQRALEKITEHYFRDEGEAWNSNTHTASGLPLAQIRENTWMDTLMDKDDMPEGAAISGATDAGDLDRLMDAFEQLRALGIANMTYEDWLRSQGIAIPNKDENKPELLELWSEFTYPVNTIEPTTGVPTSAASWVWKKSTNKPKFFKEPGFVIGLTILRPKIYFNALKGSLHGFADRAWDWMPNYMRHMPESTLKNFLVDTGPIDAAVTTDGYFVDMRDDLLHGDQFLDVWSGSTDAAKHRLALPDATFNYKYPTTAMVEDFCKVDTTSIPYSCDGFVSLNIKGFEVDYTQGNFAQA